jgi:hypothetical protein
MATPNKVIEHVDKVKINAYDPEDKFHWLSELDGMIRCVVMQEEGAFAYSYPDDGDRDLLVPYPFDNIYPLYLIAMISLHNREYNNYNNEIQVFNTRFEEYKKAYIRENIPKSSGRVKLWG